MEITSKDVAYILGHSKPKPMGWTIKGTLQKRDHCFYLYLQWGRPAKVLLGAFVFLQCLVMTIWCDGLRHFPECWNSLWSSGTAVEHDSDASIPGSRYNRMAEIYEKYAG